MSFLIKTFLASFSILLLVGCSHSSPNQQTCESWAQIISGEYLLTNNVWGAKGVKNSHQCIALTDAGYEWTWDWQGHDGNVLAYPSILYGHKPWHKKSTTTHLPLQISDINKLDVDFNVTQQGSGSHNLLLESWVSSSFTPSPSSRVVEIAIHLSQQNWPGMPGKKVDTMTVDGNLYDVHVEPQIDVPGDDLHWMYLGFVKKGVSDTGGTVDMKAFIRYSLEKSYIQSEHYLVSVELGSELVTGTGKTVVNSFRVNGS